jgi:hypothetical protein
MAAFSAAAAIGAAIQRYRKTTTPESRDDFAVVLAATLTLLGLIIGFTFSMAISRYDQRKNYEEAEANAIGTEYLRTDLLPDDVGLATRQHLKAYTAERLLFYTARDESQLRQIDPQTEQLQRLLWADVQTGAKKQPSPVVSLAVSGMNDVLNSQGYTQAAWWNRIPAAAWALMAAIALVCNTMIGYNIRHPGSRGLLRHLLPFVLSVSFFLIADIDSPRGGVIRVIPQNLLSLTESMR